MAHHITPATQALSKAVLDALAVDLYKLRDYLIADEEHIGERLLEVHPENRASARNLLHYLSLRQYDIRPLQDRLSQVGLSSLSRVEPHVMIALERTLAMLALARQAGMPDFSDGPSPIGFRQGQQMLEQNAGRLLGPVGQRRKVRIMVTLPGSAAEEPDLIRKLLNAGMSMARINCAHDDQDCWAALVSHVHQAREDLGVSCRICMDLAGPKLRTGAEMIHAEDHRVFRGDWMLLLPAIDPGNPPPEPAEWLRRETELGQSQAISIKQDAENGHTALEPPLQWKAVITCEIPEIFRDTLCGEPIWFDDGLIGGEIVTAAEHGLAIRVTQAAPAGRKIKAEKGINLPGSNLRLKALSALDRENIPFVVKHADLIAMSFVNREEDVVDLLDALDQHHASALGLVLKIETRNGFMNLPQLLLRAMKRREVGAMIARGDLAVESGFVRLAEVQEEILRIAEAAHVPTIWATQVLENLAKTGLPSRAEVTDAAVGVRAEAVMLNKGPYILQAVQALEDILISMQRHQTKKRSWLPRWEAGHGPSLH